MLFVTIKGTFVSNDFFEKIFYSYAELPSYRLTTPPNCCIIMKVCKDTVFTNIVIEGKIKMADEKKIILTAQGLKDLQDELQNLKVVRRKEVAVKIKEARAQGDLSENAEYDAAKEEQAEIETRITQIEQIFRNYEVIEEVNTGRVNLGNTVTLYDTEMEEEVTYTLVGPAEANPLEGKLSNESPLGLAMLGHAVGETIYSEAPDGAIEYEIRDIKL